VSKNITLQYQFTTLSAREYIKSHSIILTMGRGERCKTYHHFGKWGSTISRFKTSYHL